MIRKAIIVVLTVAGLATLLALPVSYRVHEPHHSLADDPTDKVGFADQALWRWLNRHAPRRGYYWCIGEREGSRAFVAANAGHLMVAFSSPTKRSPPTEMHATRTFGPFTIERAVWRSVARGCNVEQRRWTDARKGAFRKLVRSGEVKMTHLRMSLWFPFILFAAYPTIALTRGPMRRWRRRRKGLCLKCGYDLTGNESGVCPECGSEVDTP